MPDSSASAAVFLPFGSLMGSIPIDAVSRRRVLGDFSTVLHPNRSTAGRPATSVVAGSQPACAASPPSPIPSGDGGI